MYTPKPLRVNVFKNTVLPSNKSLFGRIPERKEREVLVTDDMDIPSSMSKIESFEFMKQYDNMMSQRESAVNNSSANHQSPIADSSGEL